jgi:ketosteroid isomerase-like protein
MATPAGERAIDAALSVGNAILKFISPNDAGATGSHQAGFYLPKGAWQMYAPFGPQKDRLDENEVHITWPDGRITDSRVKWYGQKTRSEYRLTRFGRDFPFLTAQNVGDLLVLVPQSHTDFSAFVLDLDEDIDELLATLGVQPFEHWGIYQNGAPVVENEDECLRRLFNDFNSKLTVFPSGEVFSNAAREFVQKCVRNIETMPLDDALLKWMETEYQLFQSAERLLCQEEISRLFKDVDDFLKTAARLMNRRKSRAGRSLENHVDHALTIAGIPHEMRPDIDGKPDIVIPSAAAYLDSSYPTNKLRIVGVKTTCKDRWRQVLNEGKRVAHKFIFTTQPGISSNQLNEMHASDVTLVVPRRLHSEYPTQHEIELLNLAEFVDDTRKLIA